MVKLGEALTKVVAMLGVILCLCLFTAAILIWAVDVSILVGIVDISILVRALLSFPLLFCGVSLGSTCEMLLED